MILPIPPIMTWFLWPLAVPVNIDQAASPLVKFFPLSLCPGMGRPRGKGKKSMEAASNDDDGSGGEEVAPTHKTRGRPQKPTPLKDDTDEAEDIAKVEEDGDGVKPIASSKDPNSSLENHGGKKRRRRQLKQSSDSIEDGDKDDHVTPKSNGFRQNGSRRKSTPRRAAEAGVECK